jgi:tetratricopeptide (TPR) repeat protein
MTALERALEGLGEVARDERTLASFSGLGAAELAKLLALALARMRAGLNSDAARVLRALRALDPGNAVFAQYLGLALERSKDVDGALAAYRDQIRLLTSRGSDPEALKEGYLLRARLLALSGRREEAKSDLDHASGGFTDRTLDREFLNLKRALGDVP